MRLDRPCYGSSKKYIKTRPEDGVTYGSEAVGNLVADNVDTTVSGDGDDRLQVSEINTYWSLKSKRALFVSFYAPKTQE